MVPDFLASGERARLFPVLADTSKEGRSLSIFLATLCAVDEFTKALLASVGQRVGARGKLTAYTEVVLKNAGPEKLRPDALLTLHTGQRSWTALVEAKVGKNELNPDQVESYAALAKTFGIDAVITISNQFVALPDHHPVTLPKSLTKHVQLFHWSWMSVITQASLLISSNDVADTDQSFILREMLRFFGHPSAGVSSFDQMNPEWREFVSKVQAGAKLPKNSLDVENTVASWHQEVRDLALIMSRKLQRDVTVRLNRRESGSPADRLRSDIDLLINDACLGCTLIVPDAAAPLDIKADLKSRCVTASIKLSAPVDRKSTKARTNWLLKMMAKSEPNDTHIRANWPGRATATQAPLTSLRDDPECLVGENKQLVPGSFEIFMLKDLGARFAGRRTFIEELEKLVPAFYENVGQRLSAWQPPAPKIKPELTTEALESLDDESENPPSDDEQTGTQTGQ